MASDLVSSWRTGGLPPDVRSASGLRRQAEILVGRASASPEHVGWTMVTIVSEFWRERLSVGPSGRRLLLLPDCPQASGERVDGVPHVCGPQCCITTLWSAARDSGWVVESTSRALPAIGGLVAGQFDGILGVARLADLEKAFARLPAFALPVAAVPCETIQPGGFGSCAEATMALGIDVEWVLGLLGVAGGAIAPVGDHLPLLREAAALFTSESLEHLTTSLGMAGALGEFSGRHDGIRPLLSTGGLAGEFLRRGGKFLRPFITLAAFDALCRDLQDAGQDGAASLPAVRESVKAAAVAIEVFHKASLVHDDIEDGDRVRYGRPTVHIERGVPIAINMGDYLVGLGYRIVSDLPGVDAHTQRDLVAMLADAHLRLAQGQGAELWWRDSAEKRLSPAESLEIYGLKTSPAFEAAIAMGIRLAGIDPERAGAIARYARHVGTGFQILNDLKDWSGDLENDRRVAGDLLGGRPTLMWALAMERLDGDDRGVLREVTGKAGAPDAGAEAIAAAIGTARMLFEKADVFRRAADIVDHQRAAASAAAATCRHRRLRDVLEFLLDLAVPELAAKGMAV
jgi:geranylgeranyl pyrophosphate synthase